MRLYYHPFSTNSRRALTAAIHLGIPVERIVVDLAKGEQKRPEYLKLNPNGRVPTLDDDGFVLWESRAIMMYLCDKTPGQTLYPTEPRARAEVNRWLFWDAVHWSPALSVVIYEKVVKAIAGLGAPDAAEIARGEKLIAPLVPVLDGHLAGRDWIAGATVTLADFAIAVPLALADRAGIALPANVTAWFQRVGALDAWKQATPPLPAR